MATLKELINYSKQNPASDIAVKLQKAITGGAYDSQAQQEGIDLSWAGRPTPVQPENPDLVKQKQILNFTGGEKLAEGLGKGIAAPETQKKLSDLQQQNSDIELNLTKMILQHKKEGKDTTRLESALNTIKQNATDLSTAQQNVVNDLPTNKEVVGSAVRLAGTAAAGSLVKGANLLTGADKATTVLGGVLKGTASGAISGGIEGAAQGAGLAAEQNKSSEEILASGLIGGATGAVLGGGIGAVSGGVAGGVKGSTVKANNFSTELASEPLTPKARAEAIYQGRLKDPTLLGKAEVLFSNRDKQLGDAIKGVVKPKATLGENIDNITNKVSDINKGVIKYVADNKVPLNMNQLKSQLNSGKEDLKLIFASETNAEKTYNAVVKSFMDTVKSGDTSGVLEARQSFDNIPAVKKLLESDKLGENARKEIVLAVRGAANKYVSDLLPAGNPYKSSLLQETRMLEALGNIAEKSKNIIGKNKLQILTEQYPILKWLVGGLGIGIAGGLLGRAVGVGSTIIGSSD